MIMEGSHRVCMAKLTLRYTLSPDKLLKHIQPWSNVANLTTIIQKRLASSLETSPCARGDFSSILETEMTVTYCFSAVAALASANVV